MVRKVLYITGTRADYGSMRDVLKTINKSPLLELEIAVTGMHLMSEFGTTKRVIERDGFKLHEIEAWFEDDTKESMAIFIGKFIEILTKKVAEIKPDIILLLGDRSEMLAGAIVGTYLSIPIAHIRGGEISSTVDDIARHAITKFAHIHFPITEKSRERILRMGENRDYVFRIDIPELEMISKLPQDRSKELLKKYNLDILKPILLVLQHPVTTEVDDAQMQMRETLGAILELQHQTILIYPNADSGGRAIIETINLYKKHPFITTFKNIPHDEYLGLLQLADVLIGNSSSGITEAPSFGLPVVNVGTRQNGRERAENIIDVGYDREEIKEAIAKALFDEIFKHELEHCENPYIGEKSNVRIVDILSRIEINNSLLQKKLAY